MMDGPRSGQDTDAPERAARLAMLRELERKVLWLSTYMIHHANHEIDRGDDLKVGGHQASSASVATLLTALYFHILKPEDRVAVKPHAAPIFHAIQYLLGHQTADKMLNFRGFGGVQSYPSRTKDTADIDLSTGSVGLGVAAAGFASLVQDYLKARGWGKPWSEGRMVAILGDAELDEGNVHEALLEFWKHGLRNCWWIIDYNRQSLDNVVSDQLFQKLAGVFETMGWRVVLIKYGKLLEAAFKRPGGARLRRWIDDCPNLVYSALTFQGGAAFRKQMHADVTDSPEMLALVDSYTDADLGRLMTNLGGTDIETIIETFETVPDGKPVCFIAYTIKGFGLPFQGHKDNHAGLMTKAQMAEFRMQHGIAQGAEWDKYAGLAFGRSEIDAFLSKVPFNARGRRRLSAPVIDVPPMPVIESKSALSTQQGFGMLLAEIARQDTPLAERIVTTSPDVTVSTNLGPWVNRRGLFALSHKQDVFKERGLLSPQRWEMTPKGQHIELGIAENNLFLMLATLGLSHTLYGERLIPIGTLYDPFIERGLDALNYACYMDSRFILVATPSGIALAPEGGAHQSIATPLIGMAQDGLASFEPAFVDELRAILGWSFDYVQRGEGGSGKDAAETPWLRDEKGGSVYLRLSTRPLDQPARKLSEAQTSDIINGAYWLRPPEPSTEIVIAYTGVVAPEAIQAAGLMAEDRRGVGVLAVTSADRLSAGWHAAQRDRERGHLDALSHIETLMAHVPRDAGIVTVIDGHPETLSWIGGVIGHRVRALGVEHFGQSGSLPQLFAHYGLDVNAILTAAETVRPGRPVRYRFLERRGA
jgi:pyruvate dehydrogenase E1 component